MEINTAMAVVETVFPEASVGLDNEGQVIIYTNTRVEGANLVPFVSE